MTSSVSMQSVGDIKIVGGSYDCNSNLLVLDIDVSQGVDQPFLRQKRIFEIHSATIQAPNQPTTELISARVKESAQTIFNAFIEQLKQGDDRFTKSLFASNQNGAFSVKQVTLGLQTNGRAVAASMSVENNQVIFKDSSQSYFRETLSQTSQQIQPQSIQQIFQHLGSWVQNAKVPQKNHQWDHSFSIALTPSAQSDQILVFLHENFRKLSSHTFEIYNKLKALELQIVALLHLKNRVERLLKELNLSDESKQLLQKNLEQLRKKIAFFSALENQMIQNQNMLKELAHFFLVRNLYEHKVSNPGSALVGAQLSLDWENFIHNYRLIAHDPEAIQEHLEQSLALKITGQALEEVVNIQDLLEACNLLEPEDEFFDCLSENGDDDSISFASCQETR